MKLEGKVAIVTGGGGGIGRATSILFAQEGAKVVVSDVNEESASETVSLIQEAGGEAFSFTANVASPEEVEQLVDKTVEAFGGLSGFLILYFTSLLP